MTVREFKLLLNTSAIKRIEVYYAVMAQGYMLWPMVIWLLYLSLISQFLDLFIQQTSLDELGQLWL